jgi:lipase ATG15
LQHIFHHGAYKHPRLHRKINMTKSQPPFGKSVSNYDHSISLVAKSRLIDIQRLKDRRPSTVTSMLAAARYHGQPATAPLSGWTVDSVIGPNITDKETVLSLAHMANNAYAENETSAGWEDVGGPFNKSLDFGWQDDGLRGHVFVNEDNSTIIIGIKGTTPSVFDGDGTTTNDKINDNLFASCCCAQQGQWTWRQVCDCATSTFTCNNTCAVKALREESRYYTAATHIFTNITALYPNSNVWLAGHSLGGAVSSLLGLTYGLPTVTFEAVPDALAATRLGLPIPPDAVIGSPQTRSQTGAYHIGHTADPVFMGVCNGATSTCSMAGYAFESQCHTGSRCVYDVVGDKGWSVSIRTHSLRNVIDDVITQYDTVPECEPEPECQDCFNWKYYESNHTETTTSKSSTSTTSSLTRTRTETCKTPGWWGCLDEDTSTTTTTTSTSTTKKSSTITTTSTTSTTTTCKTPGWFGCNDRTTTPAFAPVYFPTPTQKALATSSTPPSRP